MSAKSKDAQASDSPGKPGGQAGGKAGGPRGKQGVDSAVLVMGGLTLALVVWAFVKGPDLPLKGLQASFELLRGVWLPLLLGFCLAGFF